MNGSTNDKSVNDRSSTQSTRKLPITYSRLIVSGGGNKLHVYLGALKYLEQHNPQNFTHLIAVSGGAMLAASLAFGYTVDEFLRQESKTPFEFRYSWLLSWMVTCYRDGGCVHIDHFRELLTKFIKETKPGYEKWTFKDLFDKRKVILEIPVISTQHAHRLVFNYRNTPDDLIVEALVATSALPTIFTPYYYKNDILLDGGLFAACPWNMIDHPPFIGSSGNTLGLWLDYVQENQCLRNPISWWSLFNRFIEVPFGVLARYELDEHSKTNHCETCTCQTHRKKQPIKHLIRLLVNNATYGGMFGNLFPGSEQKQSLYKLGWKQTKQFFETQKQTE